MKELSNCRICPRECGVDRIAGEKGICGAGNKIRLSRAFLHRWEEPCISGERGSGAIFFSGCSLQCVFCQNYRISQEHRGQEIEQETFTELCLELQDQGANNINLVSPTPYLPLIREGLLLARAGGLKIPIVYNSHGYESIAALKTLAGLIDIYLPDLKYASPEYSARYSHVGDYFSHASLAVLEMFRQVGEPVFNAEGLAEKGLIIRHLILPGLKDDSREILRWIAREMPQGVYLSLMGQYTPVYRAYQYQELARTLTSQEYEEVIEEFFDLGLENGFVQDLDAADMSYIPDFVD